MMNLSHMNCLMNKLPAMKCLFLLVFIISGCSSTAGLRHSGPTKVKTFKGNYEELALCAIEKIDEKSSVMNNLRVNKFKKNARITVVNPESYNARCDFLFSQDGEDRVVVESRGMMTITGRDGWPSVFWPGIEQCGIALNVGSLTNSRKIVENPITSSIEDIKEMLVRGSTTKMEVLEKLGEPSEKEGPSKGYEYWGYYNSSKTSKLMLQFDAKGVLNNYKNKTL